LKLKLTGEGLNTNGIGAKVIVEHGELRQVQENYLTRGYLSSIAPELIFGLDSVKNIEKLTVIWPSGRQQVIQNIKSNQLLELNESEAKAIYDREDQGSPIFKKAADFPIAYEHKENDFNDWDVEYLIPGKLSQEGPAIAEGDVNGDGLIDYYIGGATNQPGKIFIQSKNGSFAKFDQPSMERDSIMEDVDALFFDAENDGDLDLFVVSGGNEFQQGHENLRDRLYINDASGRFTLAENAVPDYNANGSVALAFDYNSDGFHDLFIGNRSIPGSYGVGPDSYILKNTGKGKFEVETSLSAQLEALGMVTDAAWVDIRGDGQEELVVVGEWMPVKIFEFSNENITDISANLGISNLSGWWNTVSVSDADGDGDKDILLGNLGLNSKLKASAENPVQLYVHDFDNNGSVDPIITYYRNGITTPFPPLLDIARQITAVRKKFTSFSDYSAVKTIEDIFTPEELEGADVLKVNEQRSGLLINSGSGKLEWKAFPLEMQFAPVYAFLVKDFNGDEIPDILVGGNNYGSSVNIGRYDASYGWFLEGLGDAEFRVLKPEQSGFKVNGEIKDIRILGTKQQGNVVMVARNDDFIIFFEQQQNPL
jgi:hypothetical protein